MELNIGVDDLFAATGLGDGPGTITLTWPESIDGGQAKITIHIGGGIGDYPKAIDAIREAGGLTLPANDGRLGYYPWPPLHVEIRPIKD